MKYKKYVNLKSTVRHLPVFAAVLAVVLALAFTSSENTSSEFAKINGQWEDVTNLTYGEDFECDEQVQVTCTYDAPSESANPIRQGEFIDLR